MSMKSVRKSLYLSFAENYSVMLIQLASTPIVARLIKPEEIGLFAIAIFFVNLAQVIRDFGVGQYLIQEKELTTARIQTAAALTLTVGVLMALVTFALSGPVAAFYDQPGIQAVMTVLAANFLIIPFGSITMAYLRRQLDFAPLFRIRIFSVIVYTVTLIVLAASGYGYMSMAWASLAGVIATTAAATYYRPAELPRMPAFKELRRVMSFATFSSGSSVLSEIATGAPEGILGKMLPLHAVGLYSRAAGMIDLFNRLIWNSIHAVVLPHFSEEYRVTGDLRTSYMRATAYITGLSLPFAAVTFFLAGPMVLLLFGHQWLGAVPLTRLLAVVFALESVFFMTAAAFTACGEVKRVVRLQLFGMPIRLLAVYVGSFYGLTGVGWALIIAYPVGVAITLPEMQKYLGVSALDVVHSIWKSLAVGIMAAWPSALVFGFTNWTETHPYIAFGVLAPVAALLWFFGLRVASHPLLAELLPVLHRFRGLRRA